MMVSTDDGTTQSAPLDTTPSPPIISRIDEDANTALLTVNVPGHATQQAFTCACEAFNREVKNGGHKVAGFRSGAKLPPQYLYQMFGEDRVKSKCCEYLFEDIQTECEKTGLMLVGRGRVQNFKPNELTPGKPLVIDIEVDLWPTISYSGERGYRGISVTVEKGRQDAQSVEMIKMSIQDRYKTLSPTAEGYAAQTDDVVIVNMKGFETNPDGSRGVALPAVTNGDRIEIDLVEGKFMLGMVEGLIGSRANEMRCVDVTFPSRQAGPGANLSGKKAQFDVTVLTVMTKTLPEWNEELAGRVRQGMTLEQLNAQIQEAVEGAANSDTDKRRNEAFDNALVEIATVNKLPASLLDEITEERFRQMLADFKASGSTDEQLQEMMTEEKYAKYRELSRPNVEKLVKLKILFRDIARKEGLQVSKQEISEQFEGLKMQAKQKGEAPPDEAAAAVEIEDILLKKKVYSFLAQNNEVIYVDTPEEPDEQ